MKESASICEPKIFEEVFNEHSETVRNFIFYKCGDLNQAEDLTQEAFVRLWKNCAKVAYQKSKSFLFTVINNLFYNEVAHKKVVLKYEQNFSSRENNQDPSFLLEEKEFMQKLQSAIADLTEAQREVFLLSRIDKKKYTEIAELLGISVKAVEKRMSKALMSLRKQIKNI